MLNSAVKNAFFFLWKSGNGELLKAADFFIHPQYNVRGLQSKNVKEFYDYDIALIKLEKNISISHVAR